MCKITDWCSKHSKWGAIPLRLLLAFIFIPMGFGKLFTTPGISGFSNMLSGLGVPLATVFAVIVGIIELVGGIAVLLGFHTRHSSLALAVIMVFAILLAHLNGGYEMAAVALISSISLMFFGAGELSIDKYYCNSKKK